MKVLGIIAEYNPFHNGHKYHISKSKKITNSTCTVVIMSGNFTELGNIAIYDKFKRAKLALLNGADLVIELPTIYANSSAEFFSSAAITLLNKLNVVDYISFGSETGDISTLKNISSKLILNQAGIWDKIQENLKSGISFAKAREISLSSFLSSEEIKIATFSNNILGIEYIKSLSNLKSTILPIAIKRENKVDDKYLSATLIRDLIKHNKLEEVSSFVPSETKKVILNSNSIYNDNIFKILKYKIINMTVLNLSEIQEVTEGLENKIIKALNISKTYDEFLNNIKSKRYQLSKIKRILVNILLNITKEDFNYAIQNKIVYAHILASNEIGKNIISNISKNSDIELITSVNKKNLSKLSSDTLKYLNFDLLASDIYSILNNENLKKDYTNRL